MCCNLTEGAHGRTRVQPSISGVDDGFFHRLAQGSISTPTHFLILVCSLALEFQYLLPLLVHKALAQGSDVVCIEPELLDHFLL